MKQAGLSCLSVVTELSEKTKSVYIELCSWEVYFPPNNIAMPHPYNFLLCLIFLLILQNISKWGIGAFLYDIGASLAFMLHKTHENHSINANKIHTYHLTI